MVNRNELAHCDGTRKDKEEEDNGSRREARRWGGANRLAIVSVPLGTQRQQSRDRAGRACGEQLGNSFAASFRPSHESQSKINAISPFSITQNIIFERSDRYTTQTENTTPQMYPSVFLEAPFPYLHQLAG